MSLVKVEMELSAREAAALSQLVKRIGWRELRENSASDEESYLMRDAVAQLRLSLAEAGYSPR